MKINYKRRRYNLRNLTDYFSNELLKEAIKRVHEKIDRDARLESLSKELLHSIYDCDDEKSFLEIEKENRQYIESILKEDVDCFLITDRKSVV